MNKHGNVSRQRIFRPGEARAMDIPAVDLLGASNEVWRKKNLD
jgi:hypothetical protein